MNRKSEPEEVLAGALLLFCYVPAMTHIRSSYTFVVT